VLLAPRHKGLEALELVGAEHRTHAVFAGGEGAVDGAGGVGDGGGDRALLLSVEAELALELVDDALWARGPSLMTMRAARAMGRPSRGQAGPREAPHHGAADDGAAHKHAEKERAGEQGVSVDLHQRLPLS
jgi:hypothetical protein